MSSRPEALFPLFASLESLPGVGPKAAKAFEGLGITAPRDLLFTLPGAVIDRRLVDSVTDVSLPAVVSVDVEVRAHRPASQTGRAYRVDVQDSATVFQLVFFHGRADYWLRTLPEGSRRIVSGRLEVFDGLPQMVHPDYILSPDKAKELPAFEPVYPLAAGLTQKLMYKTTAHLLESLEEFAEWIDPHLLGERNWPAFKPGVQAAHRPADARGAAGEAPARQRLAYDELLAHQLTLALARLRARRRPGRDSRGDGHLQARVLASLSFSPTQAQARAFEDINADLAAPTRMNRLLQGDVGAGKTLVAFMALVRVVEAGGQGVLMAPTEILARQHMEAFSELAQAANINVAVLTGRDKGPERARKLASLAAGEIQILLGTHAVFQQDVHFRDLRLAVIDEQHRFGVRQRLALGQKGDAVDVLVMTATPIPRSLALSHYGDLDVSVLDEKPPGRQPIQTVLVSEARLDEIVNRLRKALAEGRQCYWVCPLVEESERVDLTAAQARFETLRAALGDTVVGLVHGQMPNAEKDAAMQAFQAGKIKVLVATTVIEVGVNVPNATIMVVERAEIFGLAQLHQLRGRVGRGNSASSCVLLYRAPLSDSGRKRLEILRQTEDGFEIAETDLRLRGAGDVIGTAQSGLPRFRVADLERHADLMALAQRDARALLAQDPSLETERGQAARLLLWLMRQEEAIRLLSVG